MSTERARRVLVIVARDKIELYEYLRRSFDGVDGVRVILDRRVRVGGSRESVDIEPERRIEIDVFEELQLRGFIIRPDL